MRSFWATRAYPSYPTRIHPALTSFADECCGMLARLIAYVGTLALLAIVGIHLWDQLPVGEAAEPAVKAGWSVAARSHPAFAVSQFDFPEKTETYEILPASRRRPQGRHSLGGPRRKAGCRTRNLSSRRRIRPIRAGHCRNSQTNGARGRARTGSGGRHRQQIRHRDAASPCRRADGAHSCLGFIKRLDEPNLQISGWSCQGDALPARRAAIGCILSRLILLTAGNEPKLAELFARAELKRGSCAASATAAASADWVTGAENPLLRGTL